MYRVQYIAFGEPLPRYYRSWPPGSTREKAEVWLAQSGFKDFPEKFKVNYDSWEGDDYRDKEASGGDYMLLVWEDEPEVNEFGLVMP